MFKISKEACVENLNQAINAFNKGADQLELCAGLDVDGLTPNVDLIESVLKNVSIPVKVMLRNRSGNFVYSKTDISVMEKQLAQIKRLKVSGIVFGALTVENQVDLALTISICNQAAPLPVTFHKAFDLITDFKEGIRQLKKIENLKFILSSGGQKTAELGTARLREMIRLGKPSIAIIPAGKITSNNIEEIHSSLDASLYHGRKIV